MTLKSRYYFYLNEPEFDNKRDIKYREMDP